MARSLQDLPPFDADLARASTLPAFAYTSPEIFDEERRRIFGRTWQPAVAVEDVAEPGSFATCEVAGAPIVVVRETREAGGGLRAFYNVCRHRAGPVATGKGTRKSLTCRYHGWTYGLDGSLMTTPEIGSPLDFDKSCMGLREVAVEAWGPFVFVDLSRQAAPLATSLAPIAAATARFELGGMRRVARRDYVIACNWKTYVDNYLEGYHLPTVHPGLYRELDYDAYRVDVPPDGPDGRATWSSQIAPIRKTAHHYAGAAADDEALYYWVFPSWMLNVYPDNMSLNVIVPLAVDKTLTVFEWYRAPSSGGAAASATSAADVERTIAFSHGIQEEDIAICEAVQRGLASGAYERGRFSTLRENGVHHFQSLVHAMLTRSG